MTSGALPIILPVCYVCADDAITFRTGAGTELSAAVSGDVLAFQADAYDGDADEGWCVLVIGRATILTTEHENDGLLTLDLPDADDPPNRYVRLRCEMVTGHRLAMRRA